MTNPALGRQFFHVTDAKLKPGDTVQPYTELHAGATDPDRPWHQGEHAWRAGRVWMSPYRRHDLEHQRGLTSYEVKPSDDVKFHPPQRPLDHGIAPQWHASSAVVVKKLRRRQK